MSKQNIKKEKNILSFEQTGTFYQRRALRHMDRNNYFEALGYYRKAIEKDPGNVQYRLELAELYTEMGYFDESNQLLLGLLKKDSPENPECIFAMGCNFMGMQEFSKARESFDRYLDLAPDGEFIPDVEDFLDVLRMQDNLYSDHTDMPQDYSLAMKGKDLLDNGEYEKAIEMFSDLLKKDDSLVFVQNNLALAYYCNKDLDRAIEVSRKVLAECPNNIHANCNMAIFCREKEDEARVREAVRRILRINTKDPEEIHKICITFCELGMHQDAQRMLKQLLSYYAFDKKVLHYLAVSHFNLQQYHAALDYWNRVLKLDPMNTVAGYYRNLSNQYLLREMPERQLSYHYQVPFDEIIRRIKYLNDCVRLSVQDLREHWEHDPEFFGIINWGLEINDAIIKKAVINLVASFRDERAIELLKAYILRRNEPDELKQEVFALLSQIGAEEPYMAYLNQSIVEVYVNAKHTAVPVGFRAVRDAIRQGMHGRRPRALIDKALALWEEYAYRCAPDFHTIRAREAWAAVAEYLVTRKENDGVGKSALCRIYGVGLALFNKNLARMREKLKEKDDGQD
ncbi:MAG: tetratricopeptide repeat protein [Clostridiales bacterium]|nr:tetratricopeptide repeat protein [Clostridiales bacterium]